MKTEALRLLDELTPFSEAMNPHSRRFIEDLNERKNGGTFFVTPKMLFWLRDLYTKHVLGV
jgi:hypothetical protein